MPETITWVKFKLEHPEFLHTYEKLYRAIPPLLIDTKPTDDDVAGIVIWQLVSASIHDFDDILLLCSFDRSWGALKLLRGLFERTVTLKYLSQNPAEAEEFLAFDSVDWDALLSGIEKRFGIPAGVETREHFQKAAQSIKGRFKRCNKCGAGRPTSWTPRSSIELAETTGLGHLHFEAFVFPSKFIHPTYFGVRQISLGMSAPLTNIIKITHALTLETALVHQRYFKKDALASPTITRGIQDFLHIWKFADTDFGLGEQAREAGLESYY
jgi:hypothetical protein